MLSEANDISEMNIQYEPVSDDDCAFFFFSSRRRHTRFDCDWSSDVCSSDLEVGYLSFDDKSADLLYEVINRRYERKSVILTTNRPFKEWNEVFPNAACIVTLLDRLLHHADVTVIEGDSYRVRESEQETAARRRKK